MNKLRIVLAVLLLLVTLQGSWYFLGMRHSGIKNWLMFAVANITFLIGLAVFYFSGSRTIMYLAVLPMFFFSHTIGFVVTEEQRNLSSATIPTLDVFGEIL